MTYVSLIHDTAEAAAMPFRALSGQAQAMGRTAGEALDALVAQLNAGPTETFVIIRSMAGDRFFTEDQQRRLETLVALRRQASQGSAEWKPNDEAELQELVDAELLAATRRAESICQDLER